MKTILSELWTSLMLTLVLALLVCGAYPLVVWGGAQLLFKDKANGSLVVDASGTVRGSTLLAQNFSSDKYFQPRPSAAARSANEVPERRAASASSHANPATTRSRSER